MIQYVDATFHILSLIRFDSMPIMRLLNSWVSCSINKLSYLPLFPGAVRCLILSAAALEHMEGGYLTSSTKNNGDPKCYPSKVAVQLTSTKPRNPPKKNNQPCCLRKSQKLRNLAPKAVTGLSVRWMFFSIDEIWLTLLVHWLVDDLETPWK